MYPDILEVLLIPQLDVNNVIPQQNEAGDVTRYMNPGRWIGRDGYIPWPPRSPESNTHGLCILGTGVRLCVHTTHESGPSRAS
jgi:hypothetical protein